MATLAAIFRFSSASMTRQTPTRMPYSCQDQFGTLGIVTTPAGELRYSRATGFSMFHSSMFRMQYTAMRAPFGRRQRGLCFIAEYGKRS